MAQPFRFLDLPGELRNHIYRSLLHRETRQHLGLSIQTYTFGWCLNPCIDWRYNDLQPAILATSRTVHDEAAAIMYGTQPVYFRLTEMDSTTVWQMDWPGQNVLILPHYMRLIKRLRVEVILFDGRPGSSRLRTQMSRLRSNINSFCHLVRENSLVGMEIEFNNLVLGRAMISGRRWPEIDMQMEGQETLDAFLLLRGVRDVVITGDVHPLYAMQLKASMENSTSICSVF